MKNYKGSVPLETERLMLRPLTVEDAQKVYENWAGDPDVTRFMRWNTHTDANATKEWLTAWVKTVSDQQVYDWGIILKAIDEPIGSIGALTEETEPDRYTFGYCIGKRFWGRGYMTEALCRVLRFMTDVAGIKHYFCYHAKENPVSGIVMEKAGFRYVKDGDYTSYDGKRLFESRIYYLDME